MSRLQRLPRLRSLPLTTDAETGRLYINSGLRSLHSRQFFSSSSFSNQQGNASIAMAEPVYPDLSSSSTSALATPPSQRRVSERMWSPDNGIVFAKPATGSLTRTVSDSRVMSQAQELHEKTRSSPSLESMGKDYRTTSERQTDLVSSPITRIRSNDELRVRKQRNVAGPRTKRPFSSSASRGSLQKSPQKAPQTSRSDESPLDSVRNLLVNVTLVLQHWMGLLLGLPSLSLSFAGSGTFTSLWPNVFGTTSEASLQAEPLYWNYKTEAQKTGVMPKVVLCTDKATANKVAAQFLNETILGFDLEWDPSASASSGIKRNISLIQVAKRDLIALIQVARFPGENAADLMPPNLKTLIEDASILKTGVNIAGDCTRLRNHFGIDPKGIFELSHAYRLVKYHDGPIDDLPQINKKLVSLANQAREHFQLPLLKENYVRASDWTQALSVEQKLYAASDAYACYRLFWILDEKRAALDPAPPRPAAYELRLPIRLACGQTVAEYLADQRVDEAVVEEVIRTDSEDSDSDSSDLASEAEESTTTTTAATTPLSAADEQLLYAASVFAAEAEAKRSGAVSAGGKQSPFQSQARSRPLRRQLQAYHLWHTAACPIPEVARLLLVKPTSAACYVLEALAVANVPCELSRVKLDILPRVPPRVVRGRGWMVEKVLGREDGVKAEGEKGSL